MKYKHVEKGKICDICGKKILLDTPPTMLDTGAAWVKRNHLVVKRYNGKQFMRKYDVCMGCIKEWERLSEEKSE